ncbi:Outer dense fiber protein 2 [Eumeta japonica]|uniref:Outer dense fiber protein 2 n=1 Tax=Eumeta variegata TaxID=151549 RepID=A0A4C2A971_EUMVA|nr:Outer dense fiber protein 2 [Eumeta japonica]
MSWTQEMQREAHIRTLEANLADANRELAEMRELIKNQQNYRAKAQARVEELARQMDSVQLDNTRISEQINLEIQCVKVKFQDRLQQLAPIPEMLKNSEARLRDSLQAQAIAEHKCEQLSRELNSAREKIHALLRGGPRPPPEPKNEETRQAAVLMQRLAQLNDANKALQTDMERLKNNVIQAEEYVMQNEKRSLEKSNECTVLAGELERAQDQAARAIVNAERRADTACQWVQQLWCLKTTVTELERQIALTRARIATVEKDREEIQNRLQGQVQHLSENLKQAQGRIGSLELQLKSTPGCQD